MVKRISVYSAFGLFMAVSGGVCLGVVCVRLGFVVILVALRFGYRVWFSIRIGCFVFCWPAVGGQ
jgi:hypothetical protein